MLLGVFVVGLALASVAPASGAAEEEVESVVYEDTIGNLHLNSSEGKSVFHNGVDVVSALDTVLVRLDAAIAANAALLARVEALETQCNCNASANQTTAPSPGPAAPTQTPTSIPTMQPTSVNCSLSPPRIPSVFYEGLDCSDAEMLWMDGNDTLFALAYYSDGSQSQLGVDIVRFNGASFVREQYLSAYAPNDLTYFELDGERFLVISSSTAADTRIVRWDGPVNKFVFFQLIGGPAITTNFVSELQVLVRVEYSVYLLEWDNSTKRFQDPQQVSVPGWAYSSVSFTDTSSTYLVIAVYHNGGGSYIANSLVYRFTSATTLDSSSVYEFQTSGWQGSTHFQAPDGSHFVGVANRNDGTGSSGSSTSEIRLWNPQSKTLSVVFSLATNGAQTISMFRIDDKVFAAFSERHRSPRIYEWNGATFVHFQTLSAPGGCADSEVFVRNGRQHLLVAAKTPADKAPTTIYSWNGCRF